MAHFIYIIYSKYSDKFYVGETSNIIWRILQHNSGFYESSFTKQATDWELFLQIKCENKGQAVKLERFIKRMKSRSFYFRLKNEPELINGLLRRFQG
jgi:putative endonuclease